MRQFDYSAKVVKNITVLLTTAAICSASSAWAFPNGPVQRSYVNPATTNSVVRSAVRQPGSYVYPVMAPRLTSSFGRRIHPIKRFSRQHQGIDLAAPVGSPIRAVASGTVVFADPYAGYGKLVVIKHGGSLTSHYAHCSSIKVRTGEKVRAGQIIAAVGSSGHSTGPHLHLEMRVEGTAQNPERFIPGLAEPAEG